ncbi:Protein FAR1-RELATED SEQUENCE 1 [Striga hermonthica]|uniref:Protein FAR1-RELATED SEQUENCE 1 n=1 Tax=Striga hermonthica TaxID=68872 RepID=A0A9N7NNG7_STRHE|nr:Protein FAR1-RELATED SEQUENCE 1 [Striga hermonthica]
MSFSEKDGHTEFVITDADGNTFSVVHEIILNTAMCSCKHFELYGWLCRHVFVVLKELNMKSIPYAHILSRWMKTTTINPMFQVIEAHKIKLLSDQGEYAAVSNKEQQVESFVGMVAPQEVTIHPPTHSKNKGNGKRLKSGKEKAIEQSQKKCKSCGERAGHNARTCPKKP